MVVVSHIFQLVYFEKYFVSTTTLRPRGNTSIEKWSTRLWGAWVGRRRGWSVFIIFPLSVTMIDDSQSRKGKVGLICFLFHNCMVQPFYYSVSWDYARGYSAPAGITFGRFHEPIFQRSWPKMPVGGHNPFGYPADELQRQRNGTG